MVRNDNRGLRSIPYLADHQYARPGVSDNFMADVGRAIHIAIRVRAERRNNMVECDERCDCVGGAQFSHQLGDRDEPILPIAKAMR